MAHRISKLLFGTTRTPTFSYLLICGNLFKKKACKKSQSRLLNGKNEKLETKQREIPECQIILLLFHFHPDA